MYSYVTNQMTQEQKGIGRFSTIALSIYTQVKMARRVITLK